MKPPATHRIPRILFLLLLMSCAHVSVLKAQQYSYPMGGYGTYRSWPAGGINQNRNYRQPAQPSWPNPSQAGNLNQKLYQNLSSNNGTALVSFESPEENESHSTNTFEEAPAGCNSSTCSQFDCTCTDCDPNYDFTLKEDLHNFFPMLWDDTKSLINWKNGVYLGAALGGSLIIRETLDDDVRENTARHTLRWGNFSRAMEDVGDAKYQAPVILGVYSYSLYKDDPHLHSFSNSLISAMTINGLTTVAIKAIADTDRPSDDYNDGEMGFPSYHTSSMFTFASVVDEYYGHWCGLTAYSLAGLVGWSRIDQRHHDLSDVVFGAALGTIIGKGVARYHRSRECNYRVAPYIHPTSGTTGMMVDIRF